MFLKLLLIGLCALLGFNLISKTYHHIKKKIKNYFNFEKNIKKLEEQLEEIDWEDTAIQCQKVEDDYYKTIKLIENYESFLDAKVDLSNPILNKI